MSIGIFVFYFFNIYLNVSNPMDALRFLSEIINYFHIDAFILNYSKLSILLIKYINYFIRSFDSY